MKIQGLSFNRLQFLQSMLVSLATVAALVLLAWTLAYWTWQWFAPSTLARSPETAELTVQIDAAKQLFGRTTQEASQAVDGIKLIGVFSANGHGAGYAILQQAKQSSRLIKEGEEIAPGVRLVEVHSRKIVVSRDGVTETIALPDKKIATERPSQPK